MSIYSMPDDTWSPDRVFTSEHYCAAVGRYDDTPEASLTYDTITDIYDTVQGAYNNSERPVSKNRHIIGSVDPAMWKLTNTQLDDGVAIPVSVEKIGIDLKTAGRKKFVRRVWPKFAAGDGKVVNITIGTGDIGKPPIWGPQVPYVVGSDHSIGVDQVGQAAAIRLQSSAGGWAYTGMELEIKPSGKF
jgi:hypothetical protein